LREACTVKARVDNAGHNSDVDLTWIAVLSSAVSAAGASCAAVVTSLSARRQLTIQQTGQHLQWQREKQREGYAAFLDASAQARDELTAIRRALTESSPDLEGIRQRIQEAAPFVKAVRRASAAIFVDGPNMILEPTRRAEEHVVLLYELVEASADRLANERPMSEYFTLSLQQEACVRGLLDEFAAAARQVSSGAQQTSKLLADTATTSCEEEHSWLLDYLSAELDCDKAAINADRLLAETGISSIGVLQLTQAAARHFGLDPRRTWPVSSLLFSASVSELAAYLAHSRQDAEPSQKRSQLSRSE
jgi:septal ring factor EnvC (AmiA/AmiB activator)